jgi:hypothetical protein
MFKGKNVCAKFGLWDCSKTQMPFQGFACFIRASFSILDLGRASRQAYSQAWLLTNPQVRQHIRAVFQTLKAQALAILKMPLAQIL